MLPARSARRNAGGAEPGNPGRNGCFISIQRGRGNRWTVPAAVLTLLFPVVLSPVTASAQGEAVILDHVDGELSPGTVALGGTVTLWLRFDNPSPTDYTGLSSGFIIYSPDGATWDTTWAEVATPFSNLGWELLQINLKNSDGLGEDSLALFAVEYYDDGLYSGYDDLAMSISIAMEFDPGLAGKTVCVDSSYVPPTATWVWTTGFINASPTWDGPHCFTIGDPCAGADADADGVCDGDDNCLLTFNPDQEESDGDLVGDSCDVCPHDPLDDSDGDGFCADVDNCPTIPNPGQEDIDGDGRGDACDDVAVIFSASATSGCAPQTIQFTESSFAPDPIVSWTWYFGDGDSSMVREPTHIYDSEGVYDVKLVVFDGTLTDSTIKPGYVNILECVDSTGFGVIEGPFADMFFMTSGDLDNDNNIDLVFSGQLEPTYVAWGEPGAAFSTPVAMSASDIRYAAMLIDYINTDTLLDVLAIQNSVLGSGRTYVFLNNGDRTFTELSTANSITDVVSAATGYFDSDAYLDYMSLDGVMLGDGTGSFSYSGDVPGAFRSIDVADFNKDGIDDVVATVDDSVIIYLNDGNANFSRSGAFHTGPNNWATSGVTTGNSVADFNFDGNPDFAVVSPHSPSHGNSRVYIGFGDGNGGLISVDSLLYDGEVVFSVTSADANRDGNLDLALSKTSEFGFDLLLGDGMGGFLDPVFVPIEAGNSIISADVDRDGNADFVTGVILGGPIQMAINTAPDAPILPEEMRVVGYDNVTVGISDPDTLKVSRQVRSVPASAYWRLNVGGSGKVDAAAFDYNVLYGEYAIVIKPQPGADPASTFSAGVRIDGLAEYTLFNQYSTTKVSSRSYRSPDAGEDSIVFYFTVDSISRFQPPNGVHIYDNRPVFDWSGLVDGSAVSYRLQISPYFDFQPTLYDITGLTSPKVRLPVALGADSVFYWRILSFDGGAYGDTTRTMAAYMGQGCQGRTGNVNMTGEPPTEVDSSDLGELVEYLFSPPGTVVLKCIDEADVDAQGGSNPVDSSDLGALVSYLFSPPGSVTLPDCP